MLILGIETSCDDCSVAVVADGSEVHSLVTASQTAIHERTGGVVPEVAAREHAVAIVPTIEAALDQAGASLQDLDAIAVTCGPGLSSALLVGTMTASSMAMAARKPLIPVHHILGHLYGNWLGRTEGECALPCVVLTASGGHNLLIRAESHHAFAVIGSTRDDAAGEAYDKVARMLGLPYPGGPSIEQAARTGNPQAFELPHPLLNEGLEFSFSGLKSHVMRLVTERSGDLSAPFVSDMAASFQKTVTELLVAKLMRAAEHEGVRTVHVAGGVSANTLLRETVANEAQRRGIRALFPLEKRYSTDNGAMIAARAYYQARGRLDSYAFRATIVPAPDLPVTANL